MTVVIAAAAVPRAAFKQMLGEHGVPVIDHPLDDLERELQALGVIVVPDAGPLIYLADARQLELLRQLYAEVVVPQRVYDEVTVAGRGRTGASEVAAATWLRVEAQAPDPDVSGVLNPGEASAIPLTERLHATLLVDDADARAITTARGLPVIGIDRANDAARAVRGPAPSRPHSSSGPGGPTFARCRPLARSRM